MCRSGRWPPGWSAAAPSRWTGLRLDVLRPATFARLAEVLHQAADAGRPYHVVHFDGHGTYLDLADLQPPTMTTADEDRRRGQRRRVAGDRGVAAAVRDLGGRPGAGRAARVPDLRRPRLGRPTSSWPTGPTLGRLLTATGVPVLVLNACRSAYTEAPAHPGEPDAHPVPTEHRPAAGAGAGGAAGSAGLADVHARIRAYGSLAAEVADAGVPGVVAMRYNVYVVTAAQYVADLYAHLLAGKTLGQAATAARRALADDPTRQIGPIPVALQDWAVPVIYEAAPLTLLQPEQRQAPLIHLTPAATRTARPRARRAGCRGRRMRGSSAGMRPCWPWTGRSTPSRWCCCTPSPGPGSPPPRRSSPAGTPPPAACDHPDLGAGPVLWSSFEHHLPLDRLLDAAGDRVRRRCWRPTASTGRPSPTPTTRRDLVLQVLAQVPVLWVWDNTEPVTGFPPGTPSAWTPAEQDELAAFLRDLAQQHPVQGAADLPPRRAGTGSATCPPGCGCRRCRCANGSSSPPRWPPATAGSRPGHRLAAAAALRRGQPADHHRPGRPGPARPPHHHRADRGVRGPAPGRGSRAWRPRRTPRWAGPGRWPPRCPTGSPTPSPRPSAPSSRCCTCSATPSTPTPSASWATPTVAGDDAVPQLAGLTRETAVALLDQAADIGLLSPLGGGYYAIHPALPWYFTTLYTTTYGPPSDPAAQQAARAYTHTLAELGNYYHDQDATGRR